MSAEHTSAGGSSRHALDPLTTDEIANACETISRYADAGEHLRFASVHLFEPTKEELAAATCTSRKAFLVVFRRDTSATFEAIVDLSDSSISMWKQLPLDQEPWGQPALLVEEFSEAERIVKAHVGWRNAIKRRGLSDEEIELVQVDPFSAGFFARESEMGKRVVRAVSYYREVQVDNGYAHPIEGVVAVVDLNAGTVIELIDDPKVIPIPRKKRNYDTASLGNPRQDIKPLNIVQPDGPSFTTDGWLVKWQDWSFRVGFTPREGLVLHELGIRDGETVRPVIHRASVTEMVVPYADPGTNHYWKSAFDAGEYGLGKLANQLELGCDCLGLIHYFDVPAADDFGRPFVMKNAICMHEEDYGILWKHYEFRTGTFEVRRSRRLVISFFATVGNYDYGFYWYLYQDGTIQLEAKLTGIIQTAAVAPGETYPWGGMVDEGLGGPTHQHFFNARLHMAVDGNDGNSISEHEFHARPWGTDNPYGNVFDTTSRTLSRELDAAREADGKTGRYWKIYNPNKRNSVGNPPAYKLIVQASPLMLAQPGSHVHHRGEFATKHLWVTPFDADERFASGDYPNQHSGGSGLGKYTKANRSIDNQDLVVWHSFGHTHVCKPEDFPVMPVEYAGFTLKPNGFFAANKGMDLPSSTDTHSRQSNPGSECCTIKSE